MRERKGTRRSEEAWGEERDGEGLFTWMEEGTAPSPQLALIELLNQKRFSGNFNY